VVAIALLGCSPTEPPTPAAAPVATSAVSRDDQAQTVVSALFASARAGDRAAFQQTLSGRDPVFADRARELFDNLRGLSLASLQAQLQPGPRPLSAERRRLLGADAWSEPVTVTWQLRDDTRPAEHTVWMTFLPEGGRVEVAGTLDVPTDAKVAPQPIWWLGPLSTSQYPGGSVLVGSGQSEARWQKAVQRAAAAVAEQLPSTATDSAATPLVVEVPATAADFESVVGAAPGTYAQIAAVTVSEGPTPRSSVRIVVNPAAARRLSSSGLAVTLAHEAVHVATHSPESAAPTWAVEGLADYIALTAYPDARAAVAKPLFAEVRRSGPPSALPADGAFAAGAPRLDLAYGQAWSVCDYLARTSSPARLGQLYRELDEGRTLDQAGNDILKSSSAELTARWRRWLRAQAGRG
jgi:hypothetical protein